MARDHVIDPAAIHHQWDSGLEPVLAIDSGDTVHYDVKVAGDGQVWPGARYEDTRFDFDTIYNLSGPLWVNGAEPGDTLQVDVLELQHGDPLVTSSAADLPFALDYLLGASRNRLWSAEVRAVDGPAGVGIGST